MQTERLLTKASMLRQESRWPFENASSSAAHTGQVDYVRHIGLLPAVRRGSLRTCALRQGCGKSRSSSHRSILQPAWHKGLLAPGPEQRKTYPERFLRIYGKPNLSLPKRLVALANEHNVWTIPPVPSFTTNALIHRQQSHHLTLRWWTDSGLRPTGRSICLSHLSLYICSTHSLLR